MKSVHTRVWLSLALYLGCCAMSRQAAGRTLSLTDTEGAPGAPVAVRVTLDDAAGLASAQFQINFDRNLLTFIGASALPGSLGSEFAVDVDPGDGILIVRLFRDSHLLSGGGDLLNLSFGVNPGARQGMTTPLALAGVDLVNQYGADLRRTSEVAVQHAVVSVSGAARADVLFTRLAGSGGAVSGSESGNYVSNSTVVVTAVAAPYYFFVGWVGDVDGATNSANLSLVLNRPRCVAARFSPMLTSNTFTPLWWLAENGLTNQLFEEESLLDPDNDRYPSWQEFVAGTCPTNGLSAPPLLKWRNGLLVIETSAPGRQYSLESRTDLTQGDWVERETRAGTGDELLFDTSDTVSVRFFRYRIRLQADQP